MTPVEGPLGFAVANNKNSGSSRHFIPRFPLLFSGVYLDVGNSLPQGDSRIKCLAERGKLDESSLILLFSPFLAIFYVFRSLVIAAVGGGGSSKRLYYSKRRRNAGKDSG